MRIICVLYAYYMRIIINITDILVQCHYITKKENNHAPF